MSDREYPYTELIGLDLLVKNAENPNEQDDKTFNATVASIDEEGWLQPMATVVPKGDGLYAVVGGHHRVDAAKVLGYESGPCWVLDPEKFDEDRQSWSMLKMNVIAGKLNPVKFTELYNRMAKTYGDEVLKSLMGFTTDDAFQKLYQDVKRSLPPELAKALEATKEEIKNIDGLALVLNKLFREFGETLPSDMMVFSWGGKDVVWVQADEVLVRFARSRAEAAAKGGWKVSSEILEGWTTFVVDNEPESE